MFKRLLFPIIVFVSVTLPAAPAFAGAAGDQGATTQFNWAVVWIPVFLVLATVLIAKSEQLRPAAISYVLWLAAFGLLWVSIGIASTNGLESRHDTHAGRMDKARELCERSFQGAQYNACLSGYMHELPQAVG
jgi:hypothetical protein